MEEVDEKTMLTLIWNKVEVKRDMNNSKSTSATRHSSPTTHHSSLITNH